MTSSVLDGAGCDSPAPPAFSPLTDPAPDQSNREPSVALLASNNDVEHQDTHNALHNHSLDPTGAAAPATAMATDAAAAPAPPATPLSTIAPRPSLPSGDPMDIDAPIDLPLDYATSAASLNYYPPPSSQLLMALARLSAAAQQTPILPQPPSTVRPDQVSLPPHAMLGSADGAGTALLPGTPHAPANPPPAHAPLESFARIEFADSVFQMTTYAVIIGRDQRALDQARRDERRQDEYQRRVRENKEVGLPAPSPPAQDRGKFSKSYVSEEGGMLGPESDGDDNPRPLKRRKNSAGAASASGDSHHLDPVAAGIDLVALEDKNPTLNRQYVSHTPGAAAVNLSALRPSPHYVPFIGIHSPGPNISSRTKAISREHLKIQFNQADGVFEAIPLHKNGFFCEDVHYKDDKVVLRSGDRLQIKDVDFVFIVNGVPRGKTGAEDGLDDDGVSSRRYSEGGKEMSFDFESSHDPERRSTSPEEVPAAMAAAKDDDSDSELSEPAEDMPEPEAEETPEQQDVMETIEKDQDVDAPPPAIKPEMSLELLASLEPIIPKKRGPGRPPKNGIMSKREERLRKKAAMELAKKNMPQPPPGEPPVKRKVGRPRKHPLPENAPDRPEKRKYKPRKSKAGEDGAEISDAEKTIKERRREKPKTPPLELNRDDYTEEQLQKPPKNYGMLIDEVLTAAPDGLTLKQIYKRIQMKYPFYYFTVDTKGWESSVRHNLIGNDAFKKNEETHLWSRVPGIDIDAGKKRPKAASPDHAASSMHATFGQHYSSSATPAPPMFHAETGAQQGYHRPPTVPQRVGYPPAHNPMAPGQHAQQPHLGAQSVVGAAAQQVPRQAYPATAQGPQGAAPAAGYGDLAGARPPQGSTQATAYSSPYASKPPQTAAAQPGARPPGPAHYVPSPVNGLPRVGPSSTPPAAGPSAVRPPQAAVNGTPLVLKPAVAPELVRHVTNFKTTVTEQLTKRTRAAEAVAMSVINRGLGLATESTVPEEESLEKIVLGVFESSRKNLGANQALHPGLVQALGNFKNNMIKTLEPKMGKLNAERLILSAVDRVLGFADRSTMPGADSDKKQFDEAENVLISAIQRVVTEHQRTLAAVVSVSVPQPVSRPAPAPAALTQAPAATPMPSKTFAPAPAVAATANAQAAPSTSGATPASALPATPSQQAARPAHVPAQPAPTPAPRPNTASASQTASAPAAPPAIQAQPQAPVSNTAATHGQAATQPSSAPVAASSAQNLAPPSGAAAKQPAPVPASIQPQSPAHALAQAQKAAAAQALAPATTTAPASAQQQPPPAPPASAAAAPSPTAAPRPAAPFTTAAQAQPQQTLAPAPAQPATTTTNGTIPKPLQPAAEKAAASSSPAVAPALVQPPPPPAQKQPHLPAPSPAAATAAR
ncbi:hypothetical protein C8A05DRAFT_36073 [Staphylotrichum tortipilum]|uniref:Fork-head domain-containing protein n=1 Tax=Staphylotrichum tortipilum TaxID=2831512 RepID=A0AAN6RRH1_9PEZI|nr:hypothetical protein C8A05DRAFT_36073 [Staphylotrichum longicolle]